MTFRARQFAFAAHLRDPDARPAPPGVDPRRIQLYRDLFFNNVHSFLRAAFPVLRKTLGDGSMRALVRAWYADHRATTPLFTRLPSEFVMWLQATPEAAASLPDWVPELAAYEWLETELDLADAEPLEAVGAYDPLDSVPVLSPLARAVRYRWPVHRIGPDALPSLPPAQPTTLLVYRDAADKVRFIETNLVTHELLLLIAGNDSRLTGNELLSAVADALPHADPAALRRAGAKTLEQLRNKGIIAGT